MDNELLMMYHYYYYCGYMLDAFTIKCGEYRHGLDMNILFPFVLIEIHLVWNRGTCAPYRWHCAGWGSLPSFLSEPSHSSAG